MGCMEGVSHSRREGSGHGTVPLPGFFWFKIDHFCTIFCVQANGGIAQCPLNTPLLTWFVSSGHAWMRHSQSCFRHAMGTPYSYNPQPISLIIVYTAVQPL